MKSWLIFKALQGASMVLSKDTLLGLIRHLLTFGGGALVAKGYIDDATLTQVVAAVITLVGIIWSAVEKRGR